MRAAGSKDDTWRDIHLALLSKSFFTLIPFRAALGLLVFCAFLAENTIDMTSGSFKAATSLGQKTFKTRHWCGTRNSAARRTSLKQNCLL